VTQPDQKSGRGMSITYSPVKETALKYGIECLQPEKVGDDAVLDMLESRGADIFAVAAYAQKIPDRLLNMGRFGCINMHPSLLPKYRGSGPLRGPILNGDTRTGVTVIQLNSQWDAGDILVQESFDISDDETSATLEVKCSALGAELMVKAVDGLEDGTIVPVPQDHEKATYLKQIKKEDGLIDFHNDAVSIERQIRACIPWPSAYTHMNGKVFKIWKARAVSEIPYTEENAGDLQEAAVAYADKKHIYIKTSDGYLEPLSVQLEGKKKMDIEEFLRGKKIDQGFIFD